MPHRTPRRSSSRASRSSSSDIEPTDVDVLCSRTKVAFRHEGNRNLRVLIASHVDTYIGATSRKEKSQVVASIVSQVCAKDGRFLRHVNGAWMDAGVKIGRDKIGHALRDAAIGKTQCINEIRTQLKRKNGAPHHQMSLANAVSCFAPDRRQASLATILDSIDLDAWDDDDVLLASEDVLVVALSPSPTGQADRIQESKAEKEAQLEADIMKIMDNMPLATFTEIKAGNRLLDSFLW